MIKRVCRLTLILCLVLGSWTCSAAPSVSVDAFEIGLTTEKPIVDEAPLDDWQTQGSIKLDLQGELSDSVSGKLAIHLYNSKGYNTETTDESDADLETVVDEANVTITGPWELPADVKIGRQYINVGRGDGVTTFNLFYPQSMRFATDLEEYRSVDAARVDWYGDTLTVTGIVQTKFTPVYYSDPVKAVLDRQTRKAMAQVLSALPQGTQPPLSLGAVRYETPDFGDESDLGGGIKISGSLRSYDVDLQYQHGYAAISTLKDVEIEKKSTDTVAYPIMGYLPLDKVGVSWAGPLGDAGLWGELAYNRPDRNFYSDAVLSLAGYIPENLRPSEKEYVTGILGIDYFFANGVYANMQYVHGLPQEFTEPMVRDYLTLNAYQTYKSDMLKVEGSAIVCLDDGSFALIPEVTYKLNDNLTFSVKGIRFFGDEDEAESLAFMKPLSEVRVGVTLAI